MEPFKVTILGCGAATPTPHHFCSSQVLTLKGHSYMIDCGEGTQYQMRRYHISMQQLECIFISHLHGDHWFGLIGLLSSMSLLGRTRTLHIYAHEQLRSTLNHLLQNYCNDTTYSIEFQSFDTLAHTLIYEDKSIEVWSLPLTHTIPTSGFLFIEKAGARHISRRAIDTYDIPTWAINNIKAGADWTTTDGSTIPNDQLTTPPSPTRSYAYVSDTIYKPELAPLIKNASVLYHEATYADDKLANAQKYYHSTARQAAMLASEANVSQLLLGHFSHRYTDLNVLYEQARSQFPHVILAHEGLTHHIL